VVTIASGVLGGLSIAERRPAFLARRLARSLRSTPFSETSEAGFSDLASLLSAGERPFSRIALEEQLISRIAAAVALRDCCVIVGGPGGLGKSVFWENLLRKRSLKRVAGGGGVWKGVEGPVRVIDALQCESLDSFRRKFVQTLNPAPYLPSFGLSPPPDFESTLAVLGDALHQLAADTPLVLFVEDVNRLTSFPGWQNTFVPLASVVGSHGNGVIVGNSSALLAYRNFETQSHTGLRTAKFFFPSLPPGSEDLVQYAANGGHLFEPSGCSRVLLTQPIVMSRQVAWNGNLQMLKKGTSADEDQVLTRIFQALGNVALDGKPQWAHLVSPACEKSPEVVLELRAALLQLLTEAPGHEVPVMELPTRMKVLLIAEQLAAVDLVTFRTLRSPLGEDSVVVAPYHPVVLAKFEAFKNAAGLPPAS
jgi:hypothetical protein